jgi:protein arginine kinase activator
MVCDICKKADATVYLAKIVGGKLLKANLCESCAREKGVEASAGFDEDLLVGLGADI